MDTFFSDKLIAWYKKNHRDLPWRNSSDPYKIWLSEIILQQTRVDQGMSYYHKFVQAFPTVKKLASASEDQVLKLWQGLGYYSRARNLHFAAKQIVKTGSFPDKYDELLKLKGVGVYTASAIASFAYNLPYAVVDGNVYRVLSRLFGIKTPIDSEKGKKQFAQLANELLNKKHPGLHNQAMMEFGALHCKPANPLCETCPLQANCIAYEKKQVNKLPVKQGKTKVRDRYFYYLFIKHKNEFILKKRIEKDIWKNMYDFPLIESDKPLTEKQLLDSQHWKQLFKKSKLIISNITPGRKHVLSHQRLFTVFIEVVVSDKKISKEVTNGFWCGFGDLKKYAQPRLIHAFIEETVQK